MKKTSDPRLQSNKEFSCREERLHSKSIPRCENEKKNPNPYTINCLNIAKLELKSTGRQAKKLFSQVIYKITIKVPITFDANGCKLNNPKIHMEPQGSAIQMKNI